MCPEHFLVEAAADFVLLTGTSCCEQMPLVMTLLKLVVSVALTQVGVAVSLTREVVLGVLGWVQVALPPDLHLLPLHLLRAHQLRQSVRLGGAGSAVLT